MKLQNNYVGIAFNQIKQFQDTFVDAMMSSEAIEPIRAHHSESAIAERHNAMRAIARPSDKIYYISKKVQEHADLIKFEKINLGWFRNVSAQYGTYILSKNEFYKFWVNEGVSIHIAHFYPDVNYTGTMNEITGGNLPLKMSDMGHLPVMKWDVFVIRLKDYQDGYMPVDPNDNNAPKEFFVKLMMFLELSEVVFYNIEHNQKANISSTPGRNFDNKIKNESGVNVTFVTTNWNKILVVNGEFSVTGHLRIQPCGHKRSEYKLIWIEEYKKSGYIRRAMKDPDSCGA